MVRIKNRYLLFNILYPSTTPPDIHLSTKTAACLTFLRPSPPHLTTGLLVSLIRQEIQVLFGDHGLSTTQSALRIVYFSPTTSTGILRVPRAYFRIVWAALSFLSMIPGERGGATGRGGGGAGQQRRRGEEVPCVVRVVRVSGTIRKSEEELLRRARREIVRAKVEGKGGEDEADADDVVLAKFAGEKGKQSNGSRSRINGLDGVEESIFDLDDEDEEDDHLSD